MGSFWFDANFLKYEFADFIGSILKKLVSYQKKDPSIGMTTTKAFRDLLA